MRGSLVALGIAVVVGAAAVVVPLAVVDGTVEGTPVAAEIPFVDPSLEPTAPPVPQAACAGEGRLAAGGSSLAADALDQAIASYLAACPAKTITYDPVGTGAGIESFASGSTAMAVTDRPLDADEQVGRCDVQQVPLVMHPVRLRYRLAGIDDLRLDAETVTKIFTGAITQWNDPAIAALNQGTTFSAVPITVVSRSDETGTTAAFQQYLATAGGWTGGTDTTFAGRSSQAVQGDSGVLTAVESIEGAIGYVLAVDGTQSRVAQLGGTAPDLDALATTITEALPADGLALTTVELHRTNPADGAYPLVIVNYAVFCAGDPTVRDFLLSTLNAQGTETAYLFPTGEWADRLVKVLQ